jgi:hypothetical protein
MAEIVYTPTGHELLDAARDPEHWIVIRHKILTAEAMARMIELGMISPEQMQGLMQQDDMATAAAFALVEGDIPRHVESVRFSDEELKPYNGGT